MLPLPRRVGRTGRAGAKGTALTFIAPDEEQYAPDLVKALKESSAPIPQDLQVGGVAAGQLAAWEPSRLTG
jgi:ATP-dependent RNA helicase DDX46/PRP5